MSKLRLVIFFVCVFIIGGLLYGCAKEERPIRLTRVGPPEGKLKLRELKVSSEAFENDAAIPAKYTADGEDVSPPLSWNSYSMIVQEMALICSDPDAPSGEWIHWVIYGIPASARALPEGVPTTEIVEELGGAKQGRNDFGKIGYGGPAPPKGPAHHYHFRLYALKAQTNLEPGATAAELKKVMEDIIVGEAELVGTYSR